MKEVSFRSVDLGVGICKAKKLLLVLQDEECVRDMH